MHKLITLVSLFTCYYNAIAGVIKTQEIVNPMDPFQHRVTVHHPLGQPYRWLKTNRIPGNAIVAGSVASYNLFVCRSEDFKGIRHTGQLKAGYCYIATQSKVVKRHQYEVLTGTGLFWSPGANGYAPATAIPASHRNGLPSYVCKAKFQGNWYPGELYGQGCIITSYGQTIPISPYQVLQTAADNEPRRRWVTYSQSIG